MSKQPFPRRWFQTRPYQFLVASVLVMASGTVVSDSSALANKTKTTEAGSTSRQIRAQKPKALPSRTPAPQSQESEVNDPLGSPYPIPWNWIMSTYEKVSSTKGSGIRQYRTPAVISPDGQYAAYSRVQMQVQPELYKSRVSSVMFVENLQTGELRVISATSPLANTPKPNEEADMPGIISVLVPVSWSSTGDRLLARQFEGGLSASDASDYAVVWDRQSNRATTIAPGQNVEYSNATLLGWSKANPNQVIFRAGELGDEKMPLWAVGMNGQTVAAIEDQPVVFGRSMRYAWAGPQAF
jgi:hypothetical protein